jgi:hypothetical protein
VSTARYDVEDLDTSTLPKCSIKIARDPFEGYFGVVRAAEPGRSDEDGAINVIVVLGGERLGFFSIPGNPEQAEVRYLDRRRETPALQQPQPIRRALTPSPANAGPLFGGRP